MTSLKQNKKEQWKKSTSNRKVMTTACLSETTNKRLMQGMKEILKVLKVLKVSQRSNSISSTGPGAVGCRTGGRAEGFHSSPDRGDP